ncbi:MAG: DUF2267 domain-containing protein [Chloroflexota bacterium]|nr:DUF2267 domain-containing protein [Chloroflexota bacterium]
MSTERAKLFQETLQNSIAWIHELSERSAIADDQQVYHLLCATLQALRDRLTIDEAVQLGAQLPVLIRGLYYDGWRPTHSPMRIRHRDEFIAQVAARYHAQPLPDLEAGVRAAIAVLNHNISIDEALSVIRTLPDALRELWPAHIVKTARLEEHRPLAG